MGRQNAPLLAFNRGLVSPKALARVDLDRTKLSAEVMENWFPKTQGAMTIRPGTKYFGSSYADTGAYWIEFVAATDDVALLELTANKLRIWDGGAHDLSLLSRDTGVETTVSLSDTQGWTKAHIGGGTRTAQGAGLIPTMTGYTTGSVTMAALDDDAAGSAGGLAWHAADGDASTYWYDDEFSSPSWLRVDFGSGVTKKVQKFTIQASSVGSMAPSVFTLEGSNNASAWTTEVSVSGQTWSSGETKEFTDTGYTDTGANAWRYWRLNVTSTAHFFDLRVAGWQLYAAPAATSDTGQSSFSGGGVSLNAGAVGSTARVRKSVTVSDTGTEHALAIQVTRGPVTIRVGSTSGDDDLVSETDLATGYHNLAFTPLSTTFHITLQTSDRVDRIVGSLAMSSSGVVELITPWGASDLDNIRFDQSADVVFVAADGVKQHRIERRGSGRSWSVVEYIPDFGPFVGRTSSTKLYVSAKYGNTDMSSEVPFFQSGHVGSLFQLIHSGQSGVWRLGYVNAATDAVEVTGIADTGTPGSGNERQVVISVAGTYSGQCIVERSFDGPDYGFHPASPDFMSNAAATDTGSFTRTVNDEDDNVTVWYRVRRTTYSSGTAQVTITYLNGQTTGVARVTAFNTNQSVDIEILRRFSDTGSTEDWQEGSWSDVEGYPSSVALHEGRLSFAGGANIWLSVSDDYHNHDPDTEGDAGPINRTFGSGPVDNVYYLISAQRLLAGTPGGETVIRASSLDEVLTPDNAAARPVSSQGSMNLRAIRRDTDIFFVQRSQARVFRIALSNSSFDYETGELTALVPDLLMGGVRSMALQRQPDTRLHIVLADGSVAILTYSPEEDINVLCWSTLTSDTGSNPAVERVAVIPGETEDAVYYHVRRTINGTTRRYLEKLALESEAVGDTGLTFLADSAVVLTHGGTDSGVHWHGLSHLVGRRVVVVAQDTGQAAAMRDLSQDDTGGQKTYLVNDSGYITLDTGNFTNLVAGLPYKADYKSTKLAFAAEAGTALSQLKRTDKIAFCLYRTHNSGLFFGNDTGRLDPLPRKIDAGATVDPDKIFDAIDLVAMPFPGLWDADSRIVMRGKSPRPVTVLAAIPTVNTNEKI